MADEIKPSIYVYVSKSMGANDYLQEILLGIEEEGIPYKLSEEEEEHSSEELGYSAAMDSALNVGVGLGKDGYGVLHHSKLKKQSPLFSIPSGQGREDFRILGANAARLVKGIPLKAAAYKEVN